MADIRTIYTDVGFTIIEWEEDGVRKRGKLPFQTGKPITESMLSLALPFGMNWGDVAFPFFMTREELAEELDKNLYNAGIFTKADLLKANPNQVQGILMKSFGIDYNKFVKMVENYLEV